MSSELEAGFQPNLMQSSDIFLCSESLPDVEDHQLRVVTTGGVPLHKWIIYSEVGNAHVEAGHAPDNKER